MYSLFLAKVLGLFLAIIYLAVLIKPSMVKTIGKEIEKTTAVYYLSAITTLFLGIILISSHNAWIFGWPVVITIIGWLIFINAIIRLFFPEWTKKMFEWWMDHLNAFRVAVVIGFIIGLYLMYCGFVM